MNVLMNSLQHDVHTSVPEHPEKLHAQYVKLPLNYASPVFVHKHTVYPRICKLDFISPHVCMYMFICM